MKRRLILSFICLLLLLAGLEPATWRSHAQDGDSFKSEPPEPSGGSLLLRDPILNIVSGPYSKKGASLSAPDSSVGTSFLSLNYDDNTVLNGTRFIPPDPIGAAGTDRLLAVVNSMVEARSKVGALLWRDSLQNFFTSLTPLNSLFDPKVIYDHYENRFLVVALELIEAGTNPNAGNKSRILLAVSKTAAPASASTLDWYYTAINSEESIGGVDHWADYPGFEVDEEAVYITGHMFAHTGGTTSYGVRLWIVNKGVGAGFYAGSAAAVTKHNPYAGGGTAATTMPAGVYGAGGIGGSGGTYLVSYDGFTNGTNEAVQVVRVNDPLGTPTFAPQFVVVGNIEDFTSFPDAPQLGTSNLVETNDRRALDAVWRNNKLWLTTTIVPFTGPDTGQTTAHWFRLDTSAAPGGAIILDDQGNIGGEDIAAGTYTYFPSLAVNSLGDATFGFSASAPTKYAGAYATMHLNSDPAGTVQTSQVVQEGVDWYFRTFSGTRNRWGDYTGASLDPTNDSVVWLFNQYAMLRGSLSSGQDGRWGTAWASITPLGVTTNNATNVSAISATLSGNVTLGTFSSANASFLWGTASSSSNATNYSFETLLVLMSSTGNFSANITSLSANTTYYFRAKASSNNITGYGNELSFTTTALALSPPFLLKWGTLGSGDGQFNESYGIALDSSGNVYVGDNVNHRIQKFTSTGQFIMKWGSNGSGDGQFNGPRSLAIDASGNVYVADTNNNRIQKFTGTGQFITKWGSTGSGDGQFNGPKGIAIDSSGNVYVSEDPNDRIQKFTSDGVFLIKWGAPGSGDGQFDSPEAVAVDSSGNVYVGDASNSRIQKFTSTGTFITKWGSLGSGDGQLNRVYGLAFDASGNLYVADTFNHRLQKFTGNGVFLTKWGALGSGDGQFNYPIQMAVDAVGSLYVADQSNNRVQVFGTLLTPTVATGAADNITPISVTLRGSMLDRGTASSANASFLWGTASSSSNATNYPFETPQVLMGSTGNFSANLTGLSANTTYYYRSKAVGDGTRYGYELSFTTSVLVSILVTPPNPVLLPGRTQQFTANGTYSDNSTANITAAVAWTSSNTTVATVNAASGLATALIAGNTTITASLGGVSANTSLSVMASVEVNSGQAIILIPSENRTNIPLAIKGIPGNGAVTGVSGFTFNLNWNKDVIHVDNITAATITGFSLSAGTANITNGTANLTGTTSGSYLSGNTTVANLSISAVGSVGDNTSINATITQLIDQSSAPIFAVSVNATVVIQPTANVTLSMVLQGGRADPGYVIPITVKFSSPTANYTGNATTIRVGSTSNATANITGIHPGSYDITVVSEHTLLNVRRNVLITSPSTDLGMGTLLEGDVNGSGSVTILDFSAMIPSYLKSTGDPSYNPMADLDRSGTVNILDFSVAIPNYLKSSPIELP